MFGPAPKGRWTERLGPEPCRSLVPGRRYTVVRAFADFDGDQHPVGETWTYLTQSFIPYHDGLSLFVSLDGTQEWQIPFQVIREEQAGIVNQLESYIQPAAAQG
jgi:hypothetical protein